MSAIINTNIASLNSQRNLSTSQSALTTSLQRLSSGLRINSAKDDAAGLAIATRFTTQVNGLNQAARNANDGISLAQTGEGALSEMANNLQRIRELAVQSSNSTNSASDRAAINLEVKQRIAEIDRSASQTSFNGQKILDGSFGNATFQVGANRGETIDIDIGVNTSMRAAAMGKTAVVTGSASITGANASGGTIGITTNKVSFGTAPGTATAGKVSLTPVGGYDFRNAGPALASASTVQTIGGTFNFGTAGSALIPASVSTTLISKGSDTQTSATVAADYSAKGKNVQTGLNTSANLSAVPADNATFTVDSNLITLSGDYSAGTAAQGLAAMLTDINTQLGSATAGITASSDAVGKITFTRNAVAGATDQAAVVVAATGDANGGKATALGFGAGVSTAGAGVAFTVDGSQSVLMEGNYSVSGMSGFLGDLNGQLVGITATNPSGTDITFTRNAAGATKAIAVTAGVNAGSANIVTSTGTGTFNATAFDFETGGTFAKAQFDLSGGIDTTTGLAKTANITLTTNTTNLAGMVTAINDELTAQKSNIVASQANGVLKFTNVGQTAAVTFSGLDAGATALNLGSTDPLVTTRVTGAAAQATTNATLTVDGTNLTLTDGSSRDTLITELNKQIQASTLAGKTNYLAVTDGTATGIKIQHTGSTTAVVISNVDSKAAGAGFTNSLGVAGDVAQATSNKTTFTIDGSEDIVLDANYGGINGLAGAIADQLDAAKYAVTNNGTSIKIENKTLGALSSAVSITAGKTGVDANGDNGSDGLAGLLSGNTDGIITGIKGADAGATTNASFKVDGHVVNLATDYVAGTVDSVAKTASEMMAIDVQSKLTALGGAYTVGYASGKLNITNNVTGSAAVVVSANTAASDAAQANAITDGFGAATGTAGSAGGIVTAGTAGSRTFTITTGVGNAVVDMSGTYDNAQKLADAINANVSGVYASIGALKNADGTDNADAGKLQLSSATTITVAGAGTDLVNKLHLTATTTAANTGSLNAVDVSTVAGANDALNAVDSALTTVSTLRSTFGAVQNRFESVIASLSTAAENATGARSRIQDTDFASETASLTRAQILQQAGTAMLAQANSLPNSVLSLLKG